MTALGASVEDRQLSSFIHRIERLQEEKDNLQADIKEIFSQAKSAGYSVEMMRVVIKRRKMSPFEREEYDALLEVYENAITHLAGTPLGEAAKPQPSA